MMKMQCILRDDVEMITREHHATIASFLKLLLVFCLPLCFTTATKLTPPPIFFAQRAAATAGKSLGHGREEEERGGD
jgi:hypothetical protein